MPLWEISFRSQYENPYIELSRQFPGTSISMWCIWDRELLQVARGDARALAGIEKGIRRAGRIVDEWVDGRSGRTFLLRCTCNGYRSIWDIASDHECLEAPPMVFQDGWGYFRLLSLDDRRTRSLFQEMHRLGPTELLRKRELPLNVLPTSVWVHGLFGDLTAKQMDAILQAFRSGYYSSPRAVKTEQIAKGLGLSRSTYEEHLRKAENRLLHAIAPYLQLYSTAERPPEQLASTRPPSSDAVAGAS